MTASRSKASLKPIPRVGEEIDGLVVVVAEALRVGTGILEALAEARAAGFCVSYIRVEAETFNARRRIAESEARRV